MNARDLLIEIARCPVASECLSSPGRQHPCSNIVGSQDAVPDGAFQVPEPWSGHLSTAPILFVSSNPSISYEEEYPIQSWSDEDLEDYFENRFGGGRKAWIHGGDRGLRTDGTYPPRGTRFWQSVRARAKESLGRDNVVSGHDYALTEVVHCKSVDEIGVAEAFDVCADRYFGRIVRHSGALVIVVLGSWAAAAIRRELGIAGSGGGPIPITIDGPVNDGCLPPSSQCPWAQEVRGSEPWPRSPIPAPAPHQPRARTLTRPT